ncbi:hypothetical protein FEM48_Zijuj05G0132300 [Ziziphus jujuba var. spinosa]|uniref:R13L1/DRL21-like LRR repeat region domain-containing protein n=1 Tax=Ziziphus jujuba var. spinosa TaxID=714518 RepID=A0A978VF14_ZIZJJ|nr:hypothetical protein FEM48_Zijuj05G0132300 [Ziziphus jujuba var. spinosa]
MGDDCEDLVPHPNLKELSIKGAYVSDVLLNCVGSLHNLVKFELWAHKECQYLASFNHLPCLKVLKMRDLPALDYISSDDNLLSSSLPFFPSLQQLSQDRIPNLKGWWKSDEAEKKENARILPFFPRLSKLSIMDCPNLISMPPFPYLQEYLRLQNTSIKPFQETLLMETNFPLHTMLILLQAHFCIWPETSESRSITSGATAGNRGIRKGASARSMWPAGLIAAVRSLPTMIQHGGYLCIA